MPDKRKGKTKGRLDGKLARTSKDIDYGWFACDPHLVRLCKSNLPGPIFHCGWHGQFDVGERLHGIAVQPGKKLRFEYKPFTT
jgi:hypothetical protein